MCCHGNFICKGKMNKRNNKILINAVPIGKALLKIGVREPKVFAPVTWKRGSLKTLFNSLQSAFHRLSS